jgi:Flp pilus assembly pilin Flp
LIEYTLLLAFVGLTSAALFMTAGTSVNGVWTTASPQLGNADAAAS